MDKGRIFFQSSRGVRQGDPLSLSLSILASEVLSLGLKNLVAINQTTAFYVPRGCPIITYLSFSDDVVKFTMGVGVL